MMCYYLNVQFQGQMVKQARNLVFDSVGRIRGNRVPEKVAEGYI